MNSPDSVPTLDAADLEILEGVKAAIAAKMATLRDIVPCVLDMSAREATLSSCFGHTLQDKIELFELGRELGLEDFGLPNFFDFPSVSDQFMEHLIARGISLDAFLITIAVEPVLEGRPFPMGPAARSAAKYAIPNVILLVEICPSVIAAAGRSEDQALADVRAHIRNYRQRLPAETARRGRLYIRIADPFDAFDEEPEFVARVLKLLGELPITGILFEDVRGSRFVFESNELIRLMRYYNPSPRKILAHAHSGNGMEDAATIEAVLAGADGVWAGFTPQAAQGGHGSALMFLTNLMRARNRHVAAMFRTEKFMSVSERMWQIQDHHGIPPNTPVVGARAYRYVDRYFEQNDRPCDLDPALIGIKPGHQITPSWAPAYVIGRRLEELGYGPDITRDRLLLTMMRACMNESLRQGRHVPFDEPKHLAELLESARRKMGVEGGRSNETPAQDAPEIGAALTARYR